MNSRQRKSPAEAAVGLVRVTRSALLWALGPADWAARLATGRVGLPPLWLRRHAGPVAAFESSARQTLSLLRKRDLLNPRHRILDIGCGAGAMALEFERLLSAEGRYVGFDVHRPSIDWCRKRFAADDRFRFELAKVASPYGSERGIESRSYIFPCADQTVDLAIAKSLLTHLLLEEAEHYLTEIRRTLSEAGKGLVTAFVFSGGPPPLFPCCGEDPRVRWKRRARPAAAVAYERRLFEEIVVRAGLRILEMIPGFWPGEGTALSGQDTYILESP